MKPKLPIQLFVLFFVGTQALSGQTFDWVEHFPSNYTFNPQLTGSPVAVNEAGTVAHARLDSFAVNYGSTAFGTYVLESRSPSGTINWSLKFRHKVNISLLEMNAAGEVYAGGEFLEQWSTENGDTLENNNSPSSNNFFLIKLSPTGQTLWKQNLSNLHDMSRMDAITLDPNEVLWYATTNFMNGAIYAVDFIGNLLDSVLLYNALIISSLDFDNFGSLLIAGATSNGTFGIGDSTYTVPESYMMFFTRLNSSFLPQWIHFIHDVTFQFPCARADVDGNLIAFGPLLDTCHFGTIRFGNPQWVSDFFLVKADSNGVFQWGVQTPMFSSGITGRFEVTQPESVGLDNLGNIYITGKLYGHLQWPGGPLWSFGGTITEHRLLWASFDSNGNHRWVKTGGGTSFNVSHGIKTTSNGDCYFAAAVRDSSFFDQIQFGNGFPLAFVRGKINAAINSGMEEQYSNSTALYPNPSAGELNIDDACLDARMSIINRMGQIVYRNERLAPVKLNLTHLNDGLYLIRLEKESRSVTIKWLKYSQ